MWQCHQRVVGTAELLAHQYHWRTLHRFGKHVWRILTAEPSFNFFNVSDDHVAGDGQRFDLIGLTIHEVRFPSSSGPCWLATDEPANSSLFC